MHVVEHDEHPEWWRRREERVAVADLDLGAITTSPSTDDAVVTGDRNYYYSS